MANLLGYGAGSFLSGGEEKNKEAESPETPHAPYGGDGEQNAPPLYERPKESVFWIETAKIKPNPEQPRTSFDETKIRALSESIRQYGILQPIVVSKREIDVPNGTQVEYQIVAGERRFRAASMIGLQHMPAVIRREESDKIKLELALIENLQREDLNPIEKARAYRRLIDEFNLTVREVGMRAGKSRESVSNTMRLLMLPDYIQTAIESGRISEGNARPLVSLSHNTEEQRALFDRIFSGGLVARDVEYAASQVLARIGPALKPSRRSEKIAFDAATRSFEARLASAFGTRVSVRRNREGKGKISIEFFSEEEFQNLMARMAAEKANQIAEEQKPRANVVIQPAPTGASEPAPLPPEPAEEITQAEMSPAAPDDLSTFTV
jgi:ParB family transcriptional regulator, chromosome partitioning protein